MSIDEHINETTWEDYTPTDSVTGFIEHYGTKGMRWGVRRTRSQLKEARAIRKKPQTTESKQVSQLRRRKPHQLTNKQLKVVNERLNLETNYSRLNPSVTKRGEQTLKAAIAGGGLLIAAHKMVTSEQGKAVIAKGMKAASRLKRIKKLNVPYQQLTLF